MDGPWREVIYNLSPSCASGRQLRQTWRDKRRQKQKDGHGIDRQGKTKDDVYSFIILPTPLCLNLQTPVFVCVCACLSVYKIYQNAFLYLRQLFCFF